MAPPSKSRELKLGKHPEFLVHREGGRGGESKLYDLVYFTGVRGLTPCLRSSLGPHFNSQVWSMRFGCHIRAIIFLSSIFQLFFQSWRRPCAFFQPWRRQGY